MGKGRAILIGVSAYEGQPLQSAIPDVDSMAEVLDMQGYDYEVQVLTDHNAYKKQIRDAIRELRNCEAETCLFFFSGHGHTSEVDEHLITLDVEDEPEDGLTVTHLVKLLRQNIPEEANLLIILDACSKEQTVVREIQYLSPYLFGTKHFLIGAGKDYTYVYSDQKLSPFTELLMEALAGDAVDEYGEVSVFGLLNYLQSQTRGMDKTSVYSYGQGNFIIGRGLSQAKPRPQLSTDEQLLELEKAAANYEHEIQLLMLDRINNADKWAQESHQRACQGLMPIFEWRERKMLQYAEAFTKSLICQRFDTALKTTRQYLATLSRGYRVSEGIIDETLGSGGFGAVWKVRTPDGRYFAYKTCHPHVIEEGTEKLGRFHRGWEAMKQLEHPNIVKVGEFTSFPFGFYMGFIDGPNWREFDPGRNMTPVELVDQLTMVAQGVNHAHERGVVHRDIKPENIIISYDENGKPEQSILTDFDLAWFSAATQLTSAGPMSFTMRYASPEFAMNPKAGGARRTTTDIYSFGQLLYFAITSSDPDVQNRNTVLLEQVLNGRWPAVAAERLYNLYLKCTEFYPRNRPSSMKDVIDALQYVRLVLNEEPELTADHIVKELLFGELGVHGIKHFAIQEGYAESITRFESRSRSSEILIEVKIAHNPIPQRETAHVHFDCYLQELIVSRAAAYADARSSKLQQLGDNLHPLCKLSNLDIRPGNKSPFQVHINLERLPVTAEGISEASKVLRKIIQVLES